MVTMLVLLSTRVAARRRDDRGQTTAEYALVLLGAAALALLLVAWATKTNRIGKLLDFVVDQIIGRVT
jgi:Flp pilus assembly pilin Flp